VGRNLLRLTALVPFVLLVALPPLSAAAPPGAGLRPADLRPAGLDDGIHDLTAQIVPQVQKLGKKRVAVVDFAQLDGQVSDLGRYLAEELSTGLVLADPSLHVVDRQHLARIIAEQKLSVSGVTEPGNAQRLGQLAGAEVLVTGSIIGLDDRVRITAKLLSAATAQIVGAAQTTVPDDGDIRTLAPNLVRGQTPGGPPHAAPPALPAGPGGATLADVPAVAGEPDLYDFSYVTKAMSVGGRTLRGGLVVFPSNGHANVTYDLGGRFDSFAAAIGVPDAAPASVRIVFRAFLDGQVAFPGRALRAGDAPVPVTIAVTGARMLLLDVEADGVPPAGDLGPAGERTVVSALWGEPRLTSGR
jgi:TolB-like protein